MKSKPISKSALIFTLCSLLILGEPFVLGFKNYSPQSMETEVRISQKPKLQESDRQTNQLASAEKTPILDSAFRNSWDFVRANEWADFAKADDDSAELVIGVDQISTNSYDKLRKIIKTNKGKIVNTVWIQNKKEAVIADIPLTAISSFITEINVADVSTYIQPNFKYKVDYIPNDPYWNQQWAPLKIGADRAWDKQVGNGSILVAVIDTGIDWNHPDLVANYVPLGYDWVNNDADPMDDHGHGTHCAGIIAATFNNTIGVAGLAQVQIMAEKGLNQFGIGYDDDLANAIVHAVDQGANILSNSWGDYEYSALIHDAMKYAYEKGVLIVAAAGNSATNIKVFPAAHDEVIAVTATNQSNAPAWFTTFGNWVELAAPGVHIYSTAYDDNYKYMSGTSMACPHVSGVAALAWSQFPNATLDWIRYWLRYTADDLGDPGFDIYYGYGRINAEKAVWELPPTHELIVQSLETPRYIEPGSVGTFSSILFNFGKNGEKNVTVQLLANETVVDSAYVDFLADGASITVNFSWTPTIKGKYNITSYVVPVVGEDNISNNRKSATVKVYVPEVAIFQNVNPWGYSSNEEALDLYDVPFAILSSKDFESANLSRFVKVIIASDQNQVFYDAMNTSKSWFEDYVRSGGVLEIHAADLGRHGGQWIGLLPGGLQWEFSKSNHVTIANRNHPVVNIPHFVTDEELDGWYWSTHGRFSSYPNSSCVIITESSGYPVYLEFRYGSGLVIATGQPLEWAYDHEYSSILENSLLYPVYKQKHELAAFLDAPIFLFPSEASFLNATVINYGSSNETNVNLQILINGDIVDEAVIPELATDNFYTLTYLWRPTKEGAYNITAYVLPLSEEGVVANNAASKMVRVRPMRHILFDQTHETDNVNSYLSWITTINDMELVFYQHTSGEISLDKLEKYDVFVIIQADSPYLPSELSAIQNFVFDGGGLLVIGDDSPSIYTSLTGFAGITWTRGNVSGISTDITPHPTTCEVNSVYLPSAIAKMNVSDTAQSIVRLEGDTMLAASVESFGKVIGFADENSLWDLGIHQMDNLQLAINMIEWLATPIEYEHETYMKLEAPTHIPHDGSVLLNATVYNRGMNNETNVQLSILINGTVAGSTVIPKLLVGSSCTLRCQWAPTIDGIFNVTAYSLPVPSENNTANNGVSKTVRVGYADVALIDISLGATTVYAGWTVNITIIAENHGNFTEAFSVFVYANSTLVNAQAITNLAPSNQATLILNWNTSDFAKGTYAISAVAERVLGETDTADNTLVGGLVIITYVGDVNGDFRVDYKDDRIFGRAYIAFSQTEQVDFRCDLNEDGKIDYQDDRSFGWAYVAYGQIP